MAATTGARNADRSRPIVPILLWPKSGPGSIVLLSSRSGKHSPSEVERYRSYRKGVIIRRNEPGIPCGSQEVRKET